MRLLTLARDLRRRKARERDARFVVEGVRSVEELLRSPLQIEGFVVGPQLDGTERGIALRARLAAGNGPIEEVSERELGSAADTDSPQGVLAIVHVPPRSLDDLPAAGPLRIVILDAIQDPGNVGTIIRTAAALGARATIALPGTVDLWNAKVVRSAMGSHFHHLAFHCTWPAARSFLESTGTTLWATGSDGVSPADAPSRLALAVGNEGGGVDASIAATASRRVAIPMAPGVESLNVAVATGILLHMTRS